MSDQPHPERRQTDRRQGDRRHSRPMIEESWFGALGDGDTEMHADDVHDSVRTPPRGATPTAIERDAQRQQTREARRLAASNDTALRRVFRTYVAARAVLG